MQEELMAQNAELKSQNAELIFKNEQLTASNARLEALLTEKIRELEKERAVTYYGRRYVHDMAEMCARENRTTRRLEEENKQLRDQINGTQTESRQRTVAPTSVRQRTAASISVLHSFASPSPDDAYSFPTPIYDEDRQLARAIAASQAIADDGFDMDDLNRAIEESKKDCGMPVDEPQTDDYESEVVASTGIDLMAPPDDSQGEKIDTGLFDLMAPPDDSQGEKIDTGLFDLMAPPDNSQGEKIDTGLFAPGPQ
jgi:hypothetical protein